MKNRLESYFQMLEQRRSGEAPEEQSAVGGPYEPFSDLGSAFIVDLEAAVVHQP